MASPLQQICLRLRNASPEGWDQFLAAFDAYATEITVAVTQAPPAEILIMQGRAQQALALLRMFRECHITPTKPPSPPIRP